MISISAFATILVIGTFREGPGIGLTIADFDAESGALSTPKLAAETAVPSFLTVAPDGRHVHVCNEQWPGRLTTFAIDAAAGTLTSVTQLESSGRSPCYISLDAAGRHALVANYSDGVFAVFALDPQGALGPQTARVAIPGSSANRDRQEASHAHCFVTDPTNRFALGVDLGADRIYVHRFDAATGKLAPNDPAFFAARPGSGPRHVRFHPYGKFAYVVNELDGTVSACSWDADRGVLEETQRISSLPAEFSGPSTSAELMVHPSGRVLYVTNRGPDTIATFAIDAATGALTLVGQTPSRGGKPRNIVIHPNGRWLLCANQDGDSIAVFAIGAAGQLTPHGEPVAVKNPGCLRFVPEMAAR